MDKYKDASWLNTNVWDKYGAGDERGVLNELSPESLLKAVSMIKKGKVYDLETERFRGMPLWPGHCSFELMAYASPAGRRAMRSSTVDPSAAWNSPGGMFESKVNEVNLGLNTEILVGPLHAGTHIDALCHWSVGEDDHWYNGFKAEDCCTNYGPTRCDIAKIPPMVMRAVLLDLAGCKGLDHLPANYIITPEDIEECAKWEGVELRKGDAVMLRTGEVWPAADKVGSTGVGLAAARYLVEGCGAFVVADDCASIDGFNVDGPSWPNNPSPVHHYLLIQQGVHIIELLQLDEMAKDKVYEGCFICTTPKIRYATGMYVRPIVIV